MREFTSIPIGTPFLQKGPAEAFVLISMHIIPGSFIVAAAAFLFGAVAVVVMVDGGRWGERSGEGRERDKLRDAVPEMRNEGE
jgi:hypothetical protein